MSNDIVTPDSGKNKPCVNCGIDLQEAFEEFHDPDEENGDPWLRCRNCGHTNFKKIWNE